MMPRFEPLRNLVGLLLAHGIQPALGGSGLLHALGLVLTVRDWDLTTDAPLEAVERALAGQPWRQAPHGDGAFASAYRLSVATDPEIDLIGEFAIRSESGVCRLPALVSGTRDGIPLGSPEVWAAAYRLMDRHPKADLLSGHLTRHGADPRAVSLLLAQPLPDEVRREITAWPLR